MIHLEHSRFGAENTLAQLGMPAELPIENEEIGLSVIAHRPHGREGYLDGEFFRLRLLDLQSSESDGRHTRLALAAKAIGECAEMFDNRHLATVIESHLGRHGLRTAAIMARLVGQSVVGNEASQVATKLHIDAQAAQTTIGVWDDGASYASDEVLRNAYLSDAVYDLRSGSQEKGPRRGGIEPWPTYAVWHAAMLFDASMTIGSGGRALEITRASEDSINITSRDIAPVEGTGVVVRFPHTGWRQDTRR